MANKIKELRETLGLSRKQLAQELSVTHVAVFNYETGKRDPSSKVCDQIIALGKRLNRDIGFNDIYRSCHDEVSR